MEPLRIPPEMFRFITGERAEFYTSLLQAFGEANERLETTLSLDDVRARLRSVGWLDAVGDETLVDALRQLHEWNLVDVLQNHTEHYRTATEYERRNLQYSLTRHGEAALAGVVQAVRVLESAGALQTAVLDAIADRLGDLVVQMDDPVSSDRRLFSTVIELEGHLDALRVNTKQFNGELQRLLRSDGAELATFHEVKASTVTYLQEFLVNLDQRAHAIATRIRRVEEHGITDLRYRALLGAELPALSGQDAAETWLSVRRARWEGLRAWFWPETDAQPRVEQLHEVGRRAIVTLLQVLDRITDARRRSSSAVADFRELARWFAVAGSQHDLHRLWSTVFGLSSSRHAHLAHPDPELVPPNATWHQAPPVEVSALLRSSGKTEKFSRTGRVRDVSALRAQRAERARAERAEIEAAWDMLDTGGAIRLSGFDELDHTVFERLLELLGRALANAPDTTGVRRSTTADGKIEITLHLPPDAGVTSIRTPRGRFHGPDYEVEVRAFGRTARPAEGSAG